MMRPATGCPLTGNLNEAAAEEVAVAPHEAFLAMEGDFRTLRGVLSACRILGQSPEPIDPAAIAVLAASGGEAVERVLSIWRDSVDPRPP